PVMRSASLKSIIESGGKDTSWHGDEAHIRKYSVRNSTANISLRPAKPRGAMPSTAGSVSTTAAIDGSITVKTITLLVRDRPWCSQASGSSCRQKARRSPVPLGSAASTLSPSVGRDHFICNPRYAGHALGKRKQRLSLFLGTDETPEVHDAVANC